MTTKKSYINKIEGSFDRKIFTEICSSVDELPFRFSFGRDKNSSAKYIVNTNHYGIYPINHIMYESLCQDILYKRDIDEETRSFAIKTLYVKDQNSARLALDLLIHSIYIYDIATLNHIDYAVHINEPLYELYRLDNYYFAVFNIVRNLLKRNIKYVDL